MTTKDGYRIETWFYPAQDVPAENAGQTEMLPYKTVDNNRRPTLIICNGDAGSCGTEFPFFVDWGRWAEETVSFMLD